MTDSCITENYMEAPCSLSQRVALFNKISNSHQEKQAINPFSQDTSVNQLQKRRFSKEEYGRPVKGSLSESRSFKASIHIYREILVLCEIINEYGTTIRNKNGDVRVILFGTLFNIYTSVSDKLVGVLLRARKHQAVEFEGEVLFQRRDDNVPIYLTKSLSEIRKIFNAKIAEAEAAIKASAPQILEEQGYQ